jgi:aerotaxis receptor
MPNSKIVPTSIPLGDQDILLTVTDKQGMVASANSVFCAVSGYTRKSLSGKPASLFRSIDMPKYLFRLMWETIGADYPFCCYLKNKTRTGEYYWIYSLIFPTPNHYFAISIKARADTCKQVEDLYLQMKAQEVLNPLKSTEVLNLWLLNQECNDYQKWMNTALHQEMLIHSFVDEFRSKNSSKNDLIPLISTTLHSISTQALRQMWESYVDFSGNFKNSMLRLQECLKLLNSFQSYMMTLTGFENAAPLMFRPQTREFTTNSIYRTHFDFFLQATNRLRFWQHTLILQLNLIDKTVMESIQMLSQDNKTDIDEMYNTLDLINIITENLSHLPNNLELEYHQIEQRTKDYLKLVEIEYKRFQDEARDPSRAQLISELQATGEQLVKNYGDLCQDCEVDIHDFHQVVRSSFFTILGPKRASS